MIIALDLETTGLLPDKDKILEVAAIRMDAQGNILEEFHSLINPGIGIPSLITHITGITDDEVKDAPSFAKIRDELIAFIGNDPILGHSIQFDINFLRANQVPCGDIALDTLPLAQTFLHNEDSYSLEILSQKYGLTHANKHRALDDTRVAIELYKFLLEKIRETDAPVAEQARSIIQRSNWSWIPFIEKEIGKTPKEQSSTPSTSPTPEPQSTRTQQTLFEQLTTNSSGLIEDPDYNTTDLILAATHFAEQTGEHVIIATPHTDKIADDERVAELQHPGRYLSQQLFQEFLKQPTFTDAETTLALKILPWLGQTQTGCRDEISLSNGEWPVWNRISEHNHIYQKNAPTSDTFYGKAYQAAKYRPVLIVHPQLLIENIIRLAPLFPQKQHLMIDEIDTMEDTIVRGLTNTFSPDRFPSNNPELESSLAILFGLFGILLDRFADGDGFSRELVLESHHLSGQTGAQIKNLIRRLIEDANDAPLITKHQLNAFQKALKLHPHVLTWISTNMKGDPIIQACPRQLHQLIGKKLWSDFKTISGITAFASFEHNLNFLIDRLNLPSTIKSTQFTPQDKQEHIPFHLHEELPHTKSPANHKATSQLIQGILNNQQGEGAIFLLTNSLNAAELLHHELIAPLQETPWQILTQSQSGGIGKITQRFVAEPQKTIIIGNERLFKAILNTKNAHHMETLLLHRLPFQYVWHEVLKEEIKALPNRFMQYSLPIAVLRLKKSLHLFRTQGNLQKVHMLDPRFNDYDRAFPQSLPDWVSLA